MPVIPHRPPPGPLPGAVLGVAAGVLVGAIWRYGEWDVALAVTAVFAGLAVVLLAGLPGWRPFATTLLILAAVAATALLWISG
jgi:hypothetical protein